MANIDTYKAIFMNALQVDEGIVEQLEYQDVPTWDSVGHMSLVAELEDAFDIMMSTDDIIDFSSFAKGMEIMGKYGIEF